MGFANSGGLIAAAALALDLDALEAAVLDELGQGVVGLAAAAFLLPVLVDFGRVGLALRLHEIEHRLFAADRERAALPPAATPGLACAGRGAAAVRGRATRASPRPAAATPAARAESAEDRVDL